MPQYANRCRLVGTHSKRAVRILLQSPPQRHGARGHIVGKGVLDQVGRAGARARAAVDAKGAPPVRLNIAYAKGVPCGAATS